MPSTYAEESSRSFDPASAAGLSDEARSAVNAAFDAMATWRAETVNLSEQGLEQALERMAAAARALGWPDQVVEATCGQMRAVSKMQIQTIDNVMDTWEKQIKSASPPSVMLSKLRSLSDGGPAGVWPGIASSQISAMNPFLVYMQIMQQWQKAWADATAAWPRTMTT
jgi:ABC-type proline/glycine betaine transport system permease subunit